MVEQIDIVGTCSLYASTLVQNPGPLSPGDVVVRNEEESGHKRSVLLHLESKEQVREGGKQGVWQGGGGAGEGCGRGRGVVEGPNVGTYCKSVFL